MRGMAIAFAVVAGVANAADGQQCQADFNRSGSTEVNEVIVAVNEVLNGCGAAANPTRTPTRTPVPSNDRCPLDFNDDNFDEAFCGYAGSATTNCNGSFPLGGGWRSNGADVIAVLGDGMAALGVIAERTSATSARIVAVAAAPGFDNAIPATGTLSLPSARQFNASFNTPARCSQLSFQGTYVETVAAGATGSLGAFSSRIGGGPADDPEQPDLDAALRALQRGLR